MPQKAFIWLQCISSQLTNHPRQPAENTVSCMITMHQGFLVSFLRVECEKTGRNKSTNPRSPIISLCLKVSKHASLSCGFLVLILLFLLLCCCPMLQLHHKNNTILYVYHPLTFLLAPFQPSFNAEAKCLNAAALLCLLSSRLHPITASAAPLRQEEDSPSKCPGDTCHDLG